MSRQWSRDGTVLTQSMAILEWIEATYPAPALLPADTLAAAMIVASDIHPDNNLKVGRKLKELGQTQDDLVAWMNDWLTRGFVAFPELLPADKSFCFGNKPGLADLCHIPQLYNARRWGCDLTDFTRLTEIEMRCLALPAFDAARPENQIDSSQ